MKSVTYPFSPKSTRSLAPGQFWAVPLPDGRFGCGRVITLQLKENGTIDLRMFLAGLLDWVGAEPPTIESIAGRRTLEQGGAHIKTILATGGSILGHRPLTADGIEPGLFLSQSPGKGCMLQRGFEILHPATASEQTELRTLQTWGYMVIQRMAEKHFRTAA
ncbi:MAG TPA: Imm26 family immunity protein [Candidatus Saccharimonadia bacterium]|nr:Imm26 family immunity protein [Candidatus Saccharimonadia bacterium]